MFRYLCYSWTALNPGQSSFAQRLGRALHTDSKWHLVFEATGHCIYATGASAANNAYSLPPGQGVVLGCLFRRKSTACSEPAAIDEFRGAEGQRIYASGGRVLVNEYWGRYVAFLPLQFGEMRVLRDPTGALPCYCLQIEGVAICLSWLEDMRHLLDAPLPPINWDAVTAHMAFGRIGSSETTLLGVKQAMAGELTPLRPAGGQPLTLWNATTFARRTSKALPEAAAAALRDTTTDCVRCWADVYERILLRLSGGVDSAILLGCIGMNSRRSLAACLNYHTSSADSDERQYARLAAQRTRVTLIEKALETNFRLQEALRVALTPVPANYIGGMSTRQTDAEVSSSVKAEAMFTGAGGDQLFFEICCTWPAADYLKLRGIDLGFLDAVLDSAHLGRHSFWSVLKLAFQDRSRQGPPESPGRFTMLMSDDAKDTLSRTAHHFIHPTSLMSSDLPIGKFHQLGMLVCPFEYYDHYLREAAPEQVHPLMSQPLLELCLSTPTFLLTRGGRGRALARKAFADCIPPEIAARRSKGGMNMHVADVLHRELPFARALLLDGHLAKQGLLNIKKVEHALSGRPSTAGPHLSEIHAHIAMEAWLQKVIGHSPLARG